MRFDPYQLIWEVGSKPKSVYFIYQGIIANEQTNRVLTAGMMMGQDEILFKQDRKARMRAEIESFTMRLDKEDFENMMWEYPELKQQLIAEATFRQQVQYVEEQTINNLYENNVKVTQKFTEFSQQIGYANRQQQKNPVLAYSNIFRRSNEFALKDKNLKNAA